MHVNEITQQNKFKKILEFIVRSNLYLFIFFRFLAGKYLTFLAHENDFEVFSAIKRGLFLDVGANDGISVKTLKLYNKKLKTFSVEINEVNKSNLELLKKKYNNYNFILAGASDKNYNSVLYQAYFKQYHLSPFDSLSLQEIKSSLKNNLFDKKRIRKIVIKKKKVKLIKLDTLNLKPKIIKIDIQGHEYQCIQGLMKTIKKYKPLILLEYNIESYKIIKNLKEFGYTPYFYRSNSKTIFKLHDNKPFNLFLLNLNHLKTLSKYFTLNLKTNNIN